MTGKSSNNSGFKSIPFRDIVTFSAEHPQNKVKNLLKPGSGKWTSPKGHEEVYIDVELSLPSCYIKSLDIGNMWSHSVDIEVGRADEPSNKREPLLKCPAIMMNRQQAQNGQNKEVMRFFSVDDFNPFSVGRWVDRIRIVCRQPYRRDVAFGLSTMVVRGNNLDDDDDSDDLDPTAAAAKQRKSSYGVDMTHIDGVKKLKSKLSKQLTSPLSTPKSKYSKLFESSSTKKNANKNGLDDEFRETVLEFINDVDPDNKLEYKELLRRWVQIRGRPKNDTEKTILKELTKSHAFGISSKKTDITAANNSKRKSSDNESSFNKSSKKVKTVQNSDDGSDSENDSKAKVQQATKPKRGRPSKAGAAGAKASAADAGQKAAVMSPAKVEYEPPSINYILQEDPQKYVNYDDGELRTAGILVHQKIYKKDKKLPLDGGDDLFVEKGVLVTFYKNGKNIHMRVKERVYVPEVEPEYVAGIFKDYTEGEISQSNSLVIQEPKPIVTSPKAALATPSPPAKAAAGANSSNNDLKTGSRKRKSSSPTKRVAPPKRSPSPGLSSSSDSDSDDPESRPVKKTPVKGKASTTTTPNNKAKESTSNNKKTPSTGGECPLCQRTFNRIKELMAHCSTCQGLPEPSSSSSSPAKKAASSPAKAKPTPSAAPSTSGAKKAKATPTKAASTPAKSPGRPKGSEKKKTPAKSSSVGSSSAVPTSDCPICSKKVAKSELERHARRCAEQAFG